LDAVQVLPTGEWLFSTAQDFNSKSLGKTVHSGDLLSDSGAIVKSNAELLARFAPTDPGRDYGLDAFYIWPSGEVWFSVRSPFVSADGISYGAGDLLSDRGYLVYGNRDLVGAFQPSEDLGDFGLAALWVVTDQGWETAPPRFESIHSASVSGPIDLQWSGKGRVWEILSGPSPVGPWPKRGVFQFEPNFRETPVSSEPRFYRLRQY
jgi:hypothetical protein